MLPTTQEYKISLMIGQNSFRTLEGVEVIPNPNYPDEPWYSTGGLAIVFKLKLKDKLYALKCFYTEANERQERLGLIAAYLKQNPSPYFVDFTYLENELWVETDNDEGQGYPVVLMEWVEGKTLDNYLEQMCTQNNTPALKNLYFQFCNLAWWLQQQPIAHGDIKHDNLIVTPDGKLKLIDYDGVFVPALRGRKANEMGSPCYQHPQRDAYFFDKNLDDFSLLVLQITFLALQHQPKLFTEHYNGDGIILKDTDYQNFAQSHIKTILWQFPEVKIPLLLSQLQGNLNNLNAIDLMPLLQDVAWINCLVGGQKDSQLVLEKQLLKKTILSDERWAELFRIQISLRYPLNVKLIEKYENYFSWHFLSANTDLLWTLSFLEKYEFYYNWQKLSSNSGLPWTISLIEKYKDDWDWGEDGLSINSGLPWTISLIEKYKDMWDWGKDGLSSNSGLPWENDDFFKKYYRNIVVEDELDDELDNELGYGYDISLESIICFIKRCKNGNYWTWHELSSNYRLPWTLELIEKYEDKWQWDGLSKNSGLPWTFNLIEKYKDNWDWNELSRNSGLSWTLNLIEKYKSEWVWGFLYENKGIYEKVFQPLLNDELLDEIMNEIQKKTINE